MLFSAEKKKLIRLRSVATGGSEQTAQTALSNAHLCYLLFFVTAIVHTGEGLQLNSGRQKRFKEASQHEQKDLDRERRKIAALTLWF